MNRLLFWIVYGTRLSNAPKLRQHDHFLNEAFHSTQFESRPDFVLPVRMWGLKLKLKIFVCQWTVMFSIYFPFFWMYLTVHIIWSYMITRLVPSKCQFNAIIVNKNSMQNMREDAVKSGTEITWIFSFYRYQCESIHRISTVHMWWALSEYTINVEVTYLYSCCSDNWLHYTTVYLWKIW